MATSLPSYTQLINFLKERNAEGAERLYSEHLSNWWANNFSIPIFL
ncbi:hypothetical protein [Synechocystis sp. LKSZ1]